jgi:hypothetical protein
MFTALLYKHAKSWLLICKQRKSIAVGQTEIFSTVCQELTAG